MNYNNNTVFSERSKNFGYSRANAEQVEGRVYETPRCEGHSSDGLPQHQGAPLFNYLELRHVYCLLIYNLRHMLVSTLI